MKRSYNTPNITVKSFRSEFIRTDGEVQVNTSAELQAMSVLNTYIIENAQQFQEVMKFNI